MRRKFTTGDILHITKRGFHGMKIVKDAEDKWRFIRSLFYLNNDNSNSYWIRDVESAGAAGHHMPWPEHWANRDPLVDIYAYTLMPNHFHLLLRGVKDGGVAKFIQKITGSISKHYKNKYNTEDGVWGQKSYQVSIVTEDRYLRFLFGYIQVKNLFELYPEGFFKATENFEKALAWATKYPFSSLAAQLKKRSKPPILNRNSHITNIFEDANDFKRTAKEAVRHSEAKKISGTDIHLE